MYIRLRAHTIFQSPDGDAPPGGGGSPPPGSPPPGSPPPGSPPPPAPAWYDGFADADLKTWLKSYGEAYPNPEAVAAKAYNLEKFVGVEKAGRGVIIPKQDATPEEWSAFYKKLGAPDKPDGYKVPEAVSKDPVITELKDWAHKNSMPARILEPMLEWYSGKVKQLQDNFTKEVSAKIEAEQQALKAEWGANNDKNTELARRAAKQFIPHENSDQLADFITKIEGAIGYGATMKLFASIGEGLGEHGFADGDSPGAVGMTPELARVKIAQLKLDSGFRQKLMAGDVEAKAEWDKLHKIGFGTT